MTDIIIIDSDEAMSLLIAETLSRSFSIRFYNKNSLYMTGWGEKLNLWRTDALHGLVTERCVIVLGENVSVIPRLIPKSAVIIANALNKEQMKALSCVTCNVITCGNLLMDTVSYTSVTDEEISVLFSRTVNTISGSEIQPFEVPIHRNQDDSVYSVLAVTAMRAVLGDKEMLRAASE